MRGIKINHIYIKIVLSFKTLRRKCFRGTSTEKERENKRKKSMEAYVEKRIKGALIQMAPGERIIEEEEGITDGRERKRERRAGIGRVLVAPAES